MNTPTHIPCHVAERSEAQGFLSIHSSVSITATGGLLRTVSSIPLRSTLGCGFGQSLAPAVLLHSIPPPVLRGARLPLSIFSIHAFRNSHLRTFVDTRTCHLSIHRDIHGTTGYRTLEVLGKTGYATLRRRPSEDKGIENRGAIGKTGLSRERKEVGTETPTDERTTANQPLFKFPRDWTPRVKSSDTPAQLSDFLLKKSEKKGVKSENKFDIYLKIWYNRPYNDLLVSFSWFMINSEEIS